MGHPNTLTAAQGDLLRWIAAGSQPGVYDGYAHRVSAAALRRRGLIEVMGSGATWNAVLTAAGEQYLDRMASPAPPISRQGNASVTQQLVDDVVAAGGAATFPRLSGHGAQIDYARRAALASAHGKVPTGQQLVATTRGDAVEVRLITVDASPIEVPTKVGRLHPVARNFRDDTGRHEVTRAELGRATRIVHALIAAAERRGYVARLAQPPQRHGAQRWSGPEDGHISIRTGDYEARLRLSEEGLGSRASFDRSNGTYVLTPSGRYEQQHRTRRDYEAKATGRLRLELVGPGGRSGRTAKWADRKSWRLEDKLGEVLWEIDARDAEAHRAREVAAAEAEQRQQQWEAAIDAARAAVVEQRRGDALLAQVAKWREARQIRAWCDAASAHHPDGADTTEWIRWARDYADRIDSLAEPPHAPVPSKIAPADLEPFLHGWSPYGPHRR